MPFNKILFALELISVLHMSWEESNCLWITHEPLGAKITFPFYC